MYVNYVNVIHVIHNSDANLDIFPACQTSLFQPHTNGLITDGAKRGRTGAEAFHDLHGRFHLPKASKMGKFRDFKKLRVVLGLEGWWNSSSNTVNFPYEKWMTNLV